MTQYGTVTATPTTTGRRIGIRLLTGFIGIIPLLFTLPSYLTGQIPGITESVLALALGLGVMVANIVLVLARSTHIGAMAFGVRYLDARTGKGAGGSLILKYVIQYFLESATLGLVVISYLVSHRDGQHWLDRALQVVAVDRSSVTQRQAGFATPPGATARPVAPAGGVLPVQLPQRAPQAPPVTGFAPGPGFPVQASVRPQPPVHFPPASPTPTQHRPHPSSGFPAPAAPAANPWALPTAPAPVAPVSPMVPSFTPPGQAEISRPAPLPTPAAAPASVPSSMQNDETVLDPEYDNASASVMLDDGQVLTLESPLVLGRNPVAPTSYPAARPVQIVDDSMRLSKTHLAVLELDGRVHVVDLGATNGIHLETDGVKARLEKGVEHPLTEGSVLHFGGRSLRLAP